MNFIDLKLQYQRLSDSIQNCMTAVLEHGHYIFGPEVQAFEKHFAQNMQVKHTIGVANGTDALLIAMMALGLKAGDEIIMPSFNYIAAAEMAVLLGAQPVFVDIEPKTYLIDPELVSAAITERTKIIVTVDLFGQCADYDRLQEIAMRRNIPIIADIAQSVGATYRQRQVGALGTIACTSFYPSKPLGCYGDGGACLTSDDRLVERMRQIANHGQTERYCHQYIGINSRLDTIQAAILLAKLDIFEQECAKRSIVAEHYNCLLDSIGIEPPYIKTYNRSVYAQYTIQIDQRDRVREALKARGIPTAVHYPTAIHQQPAYRHLPKRVLPISEQTAKKVLSLPFHPYLTEKQQKLIVDSLQNVMYSSG